MQDKQGQLHRGAANTPLQQDTQPEAETGQALRTKGDRVGWAAEGAEGAEAALWVVCKVCLVVTLKSRDPTSSQLLTPTLGA